MADRLRHYLDLGLIDQPETPKEIAAQMDQLELPDRLARLRDELRRSLCRTSLLAFATEALKERREVPQAHHRLIIATVERVLAGETPRQLILGPRGCAKTTYVSHLAPAFAFARYPGSSIIAISHGQTLAENNSEAVRRVIEKHSDLLGYELASDARDQWRTTNGCTYYARGAGQSVRGLRADWILLDDPIKSYAEALSETERETLWRFFHADLIPCLKAGAGRGVALIATAYHQLDLVCRLESDEAWPMLRLSALSEGAGDALNRPEGEPLGSGTPYGEKMLADFADHERHGRMMDWYSQYQGYPRVESGNLFRPAEMPVLDQLPTGLAHVGQVRAWDLASSTRSAADYTVGLKLVCLVESTGDYRWIIADVRRIRGTPEQVRALVRTVAESDGFTCDIFIPQDPAQAGADQVASYTKMLAGYSLASLRPSGDKRQRATACAAQANIGRVAILKGPWNAALIDELGSFPNGRHDDQVDALASAFTQLEQTGLAVWMRL